MFKPWDVVLQPNPVMNLSLTSCDLIELQNSCIYTEINITHRWTDDVTSQVNCLLWILFSDVSVNEVETKCTSHSSDLD